jgi:hypothetical protein
VPAEVDYQVDYIPLYHFIAQSAACPWLAQTPDNQSDDVDSGNHKSDNYRFHIDGQRPKFIVNIQRNCVVFIREDGNTYWTYKHAE